MIKKIFLSIIVLIIIICVFFIPFIELTPDSFVTSNNEKIILETSGEYAWPLPGYTSISSYFGKRKSPTTGASSSHAGMDIPAPEGTAFIATTDGTITFTGFLGAGGYTITITSGNLKISYCHCSPNYIVKEGDTVVKGQVIGYVGPKYVYGVSGNQYADENGNPTNGATTGCHLHIGFRLDNKYVNPLDYLAK